MDERASLLRVNPKHRKLDFFFGSCQSPRCVFGIWGRPLLWVGFVYVNMLIFRPDVIHHHRVGRAFERSQLVGGNIKQLKSAVTMTAVLPGCWLRGHPNPWIVFL